LNFWGRFFRVQYRILALIDPAVRRIWRRFGIGGIVELDVERRDGRGVRSRMIGLLQLDSHLYIGHLSGDTGWTRDLRAAGRAVLRYHDGTEWLVRAVPLALGDERERCLRATGQHPFPGNLLHRLARRHMRVWAVYFRLEEVAADLGHAALS
jgi:hypothetical protein